MNKSQNTTINNKNTTENVTNNVTENVTNNVTEDVTSGVTLDVTNPPNNKSAITSCESSKCIIAKTTLVTHDVTHDVTKSVTVKEEKKKRKKNFPLHPLKKKKNKKRRKTLPLTCVRARKCLESFLQLQRLLMSSAESYSQNDVLLSASIDNKNPRSSGVKEWHLKVQENSLTP